MGFFNEIKSSLNEIYNEFSQPVIWRGKVYKCVFTQGQSSETLEVGGFVSECDFNVKFLESELAGVRPRVGEIIEYNTTQYRIEWVSSYANRGQLEIAVKSL